MADENEQQGDDLDAVLAAFEAATGGGTDAGGAKPPVAETPAKPAAVEPSEPSAAESKPLFGELRSRYVPKQEPQVDAETADFRQRFGEMTGVVERIVVEQAASRAKAESDSVVKRARDVVAESGKHVPDDYAENFLMNHVKTDFEAHEAWSHRWEGAESAARCERAVTRALDKLRANLAKLPSPEDIVLGADREAVSAAVRGASHKSPPPAPAPDYSKMTDRELREATRKFGYESQV